MNTDERARRRHGATSREGRDADRFLDSGAAAWLASGVILLTIFLAAIAGASTM
jgi:hypothetical protein